MHLLIEMGDKIEKKGRFFRRSNKDSKWIEVKKSVWRRDRSDKILKILTVKELLLLKKHSDKRLLKILDVSHIFPVSLYPSLTYDLDNLVLLNRWSHNNLDNMRCPLTGEPIDQETREEWWKRLIGSETFVKLQEKIYTN